MGCCERHLLLLLLFVPALSAADASFSECFPPAVLSRFWAEPSYLSSNPNIQRFLTADFYSYSFDNSTQSLGLQGIGLASRQQLLARIPSSSQREFSVAAAELDAAASSLASARNASDAAHSLSQKAQKSASELITGAQLALYYSPLPIASLAILPTLIRSQDFVHYAVFYPRAYSAALSSSADAFEHASAAASEAARKADGQMSFLSRAGAGSAQYGGMAKQAYFEAQSFLASCSRASRVSGIPEYFSSRPALPDFSLPGFPKRLMEIAGDDGNSSLLTMASLYSALQQAGQDMEAEYAAVHSLANSEVGGLAEEMSSLESEKLELMGEAQQGADRTVFVGGFSGTYAGLQAAREKLAESRQHLASSEIQASQENSQDFLAQAIAYSKAAYETASSSRRALASIRKNAADAAGRQKQLAGFAISRAEGMLPANASSYQSAQARQAASDLLQKARSSFLSASYSRTLGESFAGYQQATELASQAAAVLEGRISVQPPQQARSALHLLSSLLGAAQKDGLDVGYEKEKLSDYEELLSRASLPDIAEAIASAARQDRQAVLLRLSESYHSLPEEYAAAKSMVEEVRSTGPFFLPQFDLLAGHFPGGRLDAEASAGSLAQLQEKIREFSQAASSALPAHLSLLLSRSAKAYELADEPVLGKAGKYRASITVSNPSSFGYDGALKVSVPTLLALYKPDLVSGDNLDDAYYENGKTVLVLADIGAQEARTFVFERSDSPAQITSSEDSCQSADAQSAQSIHSMQFFASRALPSLSLDESLPLGVSAAEAKHAGRRIPLSVSGSKAAGSLPNVPEGKNSLEIEYEIAEPFSLSLQQTGTEAGGQAAQRLSYIISVSSPGLDCDFAQVRFEEPFAGVSGFSVSPLSGHKVSGEAAIPSGTGSTQFSFSFSPLQKGRAAQFSVSFTVQNSSAALLQAISFTEASLSYANDSSLSAVLAEARSLSQAGRTGEALSLLSSSLGASWGQPLDSLDYLRFLQSNSTASLLFAQSADVVLQLELSNATLAAAALSKPLLALKQSLSEASVLSSAGQYKKAASIVSKAESDFLSALSSLAWKSASSASDEYADAKKSFRAGNEALLSGAESLISRSHLQYSQGSHLQSYLSSSSALQALLAIAASSEKSEGESIALLRKLSDDYFFLRAGAEQKLSKYSSEFSALSSQGKSRMPSTPSSLSSRLGDADRAMASAAKGKPTATEALAVANQSYQKLALIVSTMDESLLGLQGSAQASLGVARLAASEARQKELPATELAQIDSEVARAEEMLSNSLYAESLSSSDRAIRAANALLASGAASGLDAKALALGAVSLAFLAAAAFYFWKKHGKPERKREKKEIPRAEA